MLVDTSVWIDFFNGHESKQVERLAYAIAESEPIAILCHEGQTRFILY
jgi:predicted nucleic acid-binding protein